MRTKVKQFIRRNLRTNNRCVDFIICGTQKGGTTALDAYLREHPQVCMADNKELHFFDNEENFSTASPNYYKYHSFFGPKKTHKAVGEATPIYMYWKDSPKRIFDYSPKMKLIVLLRNPIERAYSQWNMQRIRKTEDLSFLEAIKIDDARRNDALPNQQRGYSYIDRGRYLAQLKRLWEYFPRENVLVLKTEYLKQQPVNALGEVCSFIGVDQMEGIEGKDVHSRPYKSKMTEVERTFLVNAFKDEIKGLEKELDWDCSDWLAN